MDTARRRERSISGTDLRTWLAALAGAAAILSLSTKVMDPERAVLGWFVSAAFTLGAALTVRWSAWVVLEASLPMWVSLFGGMILTIAFLGSVALAHAGVVEASAFVWLVAVLAAAALIRANPWQTVRILFYGLFFLVLGSGCAAGCVGV